MSHSHSRFVSPAQLVGLLIAFVSASMLLGVLGAGMLVPLTGSAAIMTKAAPSVFDDLPSQIEVVEPAEESQMLDASGAVIARFYDKQRIVVPSEAIAEPMKQAIVAIEDKRFYEHNGVDATGIARALVSNLADAGMQGASTITQQYVRNALQEKGYLEGDAEQVTAATEQTTARKLREIKYALALERKMAKDQILTGYLNIAPFGPITYGVEAASQRYFSKSASELSVLEAALLAGLVQSPVEYDPLTYPEAAQQRRDIVLDVMLQQELITQEEHDAGIATPVADMLHPAANSEGCTGVKNSAGYFCDFALAQYLSDETYGETEAERLHLLKTGGLTIRTTLDPAKQQAAFDALTAAIPVGDPSGVNDALASVVPQTGAIVALAQNTTYGVEEGQTMSSFAANGRFQAGSTFKVFTLTQWFKEGHGAYETVGSNNRSYGPNAFKCAGQPITTEPWTVNDLPGKDGPMTALRAVGLSGNQAFISMASKVDFCQIFQTAADLGVTDVDGEPVTPLPANVLGTSPTSPLNMAIAFAAFANGGLKCEPMALTSVTDRDENTLREYGPNCTPALDSSVANKVATTLGLSTSQYYQGVRLANGQPYSAKSGTTDDNANTWFTGFTPSLSTSTWVGHAESSTTPVQNTVINGQFYDVIYGLTFGGTKIWAPYMSAALAGTPVEPLPVGDIGSPRAATSSSQNRDKNKDQDQGSSEQNSASENGSTN